MDRIVEFQNWPIKTDRHEEIRLIKERMEYLKDYATSIHDVFKTDINTLRNDLNMIQNDVNNLKYSANRALDTILNNLSQRHYSVIMEQQLENLFYDRCNNNHVKINLIGVINRVKQQHYKTIDEFCTFLINDLTNQSW